MDEHTLTSALARDLDGSFEALVVAYQAPLYRFALRLTGCGEDAEEIVQDGFVRAYRALDGYDAGRIRALSLRPWLYQITLNVFRNRARGRHLATAPLDGDIVDGRSGPERTVEAAEGRLVVARLLATLPERYRVAVILHHIEELTYGEIAAVLGQPEGTVKAHVHRGLRSLRTALEGEERE